MISQKIIVRIVPLLIGVSWYLAACSPIYHDRMPRLSAHKVRAAAELEKLPRKMRGKNELLTIIVEQSGISGSERLKSIKLYPFSRDTSVVLSQKPFTLNIPMQDRFLINEKDTLRYSDFSFQNSGARYIDGFVVRVNCIDDTEFTDTLLFRKRFDPVKYRYTFGITLYEPEEETRKPLFSRWRKHYYID